MQSNWKLALAAGAAWSVLAGQGYAQTATPGTVEELVVTARRVEENLQSTPVAISAFSAETLQRQGATAITDLQGAVPNLNLVQGRASSNSTNIYIRGIGQPDALQTFDPAVGVYVDDVYYSRIRGTQFDLLDLARVEVLRGPQGTLYGKNTIGGALKLVSRQPDQTVRSQSSVSVGNYDLFEAKLALSGPVSDTLALGFAAMGSARGGYVTDPVNGQEYNDKHTFASRVALAWTPNDRFRVNASADYTKDKSGLTVGQAQNSLTSAFGPVLYPVPLAIPEYNFRTTTTPGLPNETRFEHWGAAVTVGYDLTDSLSLKSITAYRNLDSDDYIDFDATALQLTDARVSVDQDQASEELQLAYNEGPWQVVGGVYYLRENVKSHQEAYASAFTAPFSFLRTVDDDLKTTSWAAYANASYALTEQLRLSAGVRYTNEEKKYARTTSTFSTLGALNGTFAFKAQETWDDVSPMVSLDYQATDDVFFYGRVSKGFKSGGFNGRANTPGEEQPYAPETAISYEAGVKTELFDKRARANFTVFYNDYQDFQARVGHSVTSPTQPIPAIDFTVLNAGQLKIYGAELELAANPIAGLSLNAEVGYLHAEYGEFSEQRAAVAPATGFTTLDRSWQTPAFSPEWTARLAGRYEWDLGDTGFVSVGAQARYRSEMALAIDNANLTTRVRFPGIFQPSYWLYDAQIVWENSERNLSAGIYGKNLADEVYKTDAQEFSSVGGIRTAYFGAPRTVMATVTLKY
ncbi:TonB-dependent receptor [Phenylobacterium sp. 20VBR1]|uniref:TonB-dependent receptor n=1 Tax=Phenylobacterium glaciei TaxID=2803784 RepID=A0A941D4C0_9CAUL|nr:TonB-dependent receptor [Phenylobacterium glaciei]MBR7621397.1 TonB-dependent receptor [Phenylobacterium glaciei]